MKIENDTSSVREGSRYILSRRDWVYVLGLLVPFVLYNLSLKAARVAALPDGHGFLGGLTLMRSNLLFAFGYALFWVGLFAVARRGPLRWAVVFIFHLLTILIALITSGASQYFAITGTPLGMDPIMAFLSSPGEFGGVVASEVTPTIVALLIAILAYAVFGPWLLARLVGHEDGTKYIYHYGDRPEELYDLSENPQERNNLAVEADPAELERRRTELLEWRAKVDAVYAASPEELSGDR